jgi:hypothetical protein
MIYLGEPITPTRSACYACDGIHEATPAHLDQYNGRQLWAVVCPVDGLTAYYNSDALVIR